jgi:hypothetical protein
MELTIFSMLSLIMTRVIVSYTPIHQNMLLIGIILMILFLYKSKAIQRLERVLERTEEIRRVKVLERYQSQYTN